MKITRKKNKDTTTLIFEGALSIYEVNAIKEELFADYERLADKIALDLHSVSEVDTAGVQLLLFAKTFFAGIHKSVFIVKGNEAVDNILTTLDVSHHFAIES